MAPEFEDIEGECRVVCVHEGAVLKATIQPASKPLEEYLVKVKSVSSQEFVIEEVQEPNRKLALPIDDVEQNGRVGAIKLANLEPNIQVTGNGDFVEIPSDG